MQDGVSGRYIRQPKCLEKLMICLKKILLLTRNILKKINNEVKEGMFDMSNMRNYKNKNNKKRGKGSICWIFHGCWRVCLFSVS